MKLSVKDNQTNAVAKSIQCADMRLMIADVQPNVTVHPDRRRTDHPFPCRNREHLIAIPADGSDQLEA
ncbi:MAG: hypothetical protein FWD57_03310, partial [Polyangiaceae bacterium]|nr:hypothetical protein [Polyangiaceae bacterium]